MHALSSSISRKIAGRPPSRTRCSANVARESVTDARTSKVPKGTVRRSLRVWIDLTNSPHVLVMRPVIERLRADGHDVEVTARDFAQTLALCERLGIDHTPIGRHRGERVIAKAGGLVQRSLALARWARPRRFD